MNNKFLQLLLPLLALLSLTTHSLAQDDGSTTSDRGHYENYIDNGTFNPTVTVFYGTEWEYDTSTNTLKISSSSSAWDEIAYNMTGKNPVRNYLQSNTKTVTVTSDNETTLPVKNAFNSFSALTSVTLPNTFTSLDTYAFSKCTSLKSITLPTSLTTLGNYAFEGCTSLESIELPTSLTTLGNYAFNGCTALATVTLNGNLTSIGTNAFSKCTSLESIELPSSLTTLGNSAFNGCTSLTTVIFNGNLTSIGEYAFFKCDKLTNLTNFSLLASLTSIGEYAFSRTSLKSITLPASLTSIGEYAFSKTSLESVELPTSLTSIGNSVFNDCSALTTVTFKDNLTSIGESAFGECTSLESIELPTSLTTLGESAFDGCSALTTVTLKDNLTSIGNYAFFQCTKLTTITLPASLTSIGEDAFYQCTSLESLILLSKPKDLNPGTGAFDFQGDDKPTLYYDPQYSSSDFSNISSYFDSITPLTTCGTGYYVDPNTNTLETCATEISNEGWTYNTTQKLLTISSSEAWNTIGYEEGETNLLRDYLQANAETLSFDEGCNVTSIPDNAFKDFSKLSSITLHASLSTIEDNAFSGCSANNVYIKSNTELAEPHAITLGTDVFTPDADATLHYDSRYTNIGAEGTTENFRQYFTNLDDAAPTQPTTKLQSPTNTTSTPLYYDLQGRPLSHPLPNTPVVRILNNRSTLILTK